MFYDIGIGILISIFTSQYFQIDLSFSFIIISILSSLFPDIDVFFNIFVGKSINSSHTVNANIFGHRMITHYPIIYIPISLLVFVIFGEIWTTVFILGILSHFLHDSVGIGWGVKWLWPFSKKNFKFFYNQKNQPSLDFITSWTPDELKKYEKEFGQLDWIKIYYFRPSLINIVETSVFIISIIFLLYKII